MISIYAHTANNKMTQMQTIFEQSQSQSGAKRHFMQENDVDHEMSRYQIDK